MKLGFIILTFTPPDLLFEKLVQRIREIPDSEIVLHHDYSQSGFPQEFIEKYKILQTRNSHVTKWSHINNVIATIEGFERLYELPDRPDWYITITPNCYPIKSANFIHDFFKTTNANALLKMRKVSLSNPDKMLDKYIVRDLRHRCVKVPYVNKHLKRSFREFFIKRTSAPIPFDDERYPLWHGSNWLALDKKIVGRMINENLKESYSVKFYKDFYRQGSNMHPCPQEIIIPSYVGNQKDLKIEFNHYRFIDWQEHQNWHPNILQKKDFSQLRESEALWARKFEAKGSSEVIHLIDTNLL